MKGKLQVISNRVRMNKRGENFYSEILNIFVIIIINIKNWLLLHRQGELLAKINF